jgi:hypothetical protein
MVKAIGSDSTHDLALLTDEELMSRYREQGLEAVFNVLVHRYERELYRYLARYLGDPTLADDVFQNTFLQVHLNADYTRVAARSGPGFMPSPLTRRSMRCARRGGTRW